MDIIDIQSEPSETMTVQDVLDKVGFTPIDAKMDEDGNVYIIGIWNDTGIHDMLIIPAEAITK